MRWKILREAADGLRLEEKDVNVPWGTYPSLLTVCFTQH